MELIREGKSVEEGEEQAMRWGIIGLGEIAERFADDLPYSETGTLLAVASRRRYRAEEFARAHGAARHYTGYGELLDDRDVQAVYIALAHTGHPEWAIRALRAGKHVLCEKPFAPTHPQAMAMVEEARRLELVLIEGYMYRFHPRTTELLRLLRDGAIGEVHQIEASYTFRASTTGGRLFDPGLAGGSILDVGGYPASLTIAVASAVAEGDGAARVVDAVASLSADGVDVWSSATVQCGGISAHLTSGIDLVGDDVVRITGSRGVLTMGDPWHASEEPPELILNRVGDEPRRTVFGAARQYASESDALEAATHGHDHALEKSWESSLRTARLLDQWREAAGVRYPFEADDAFVPTVHGDALAAAGSPTTAGNEMHYGAIVGSDEPISRLVMGCDNQRNLTHASVMFDDFIERGGNAFDTAFEYGDGYQERLVGQWIGNRGIRDRIFLIGKGAHTPYCDPESLTSQLLESLDHLQTDHVDLYFMHRDNPDVPVGEFIDVLNEHYRAGRIRQFGVSNWSIERFEEANAYAAAQGKQSLTALSNHFGLARAHDVPWAGCRHVTDDASKKWLQQTGTALFPWSSQARGFFARARRDDTSDPDLVRCYYSDDNFRRLQRVHDLAAARGVRPTAVALAYVLHQRFPTFALIGPRTLAETRTSMAALGVELSADEVDWLDLRS